MAAATRPSGGRRARGPAHNGGEWIEVGYEQWITGVWEPALKQAKVSHHRPYDLRHSFASLLLHEGRSVIYVARQLGHSAQLTMKTYGHVVEELDEAPIITAEEAILAARSDQKFGRKFGRAK